MLLQEKGRVFPVSQLNQQIRQLLDSQVPMLWVCGEISNLTRAASGHWYFSLKDQTAQVRCAMFRFKNRMVSFEVSNGQQVEVYASVSLYEARGEFQLVVEQMRPAGLGVLFEKFTRLKQQLQHEGLFEPQRKQALPFMPARIGLITSDRGAAVRDVLTTLRQRLPAAAVILYPTAVQGEGSARQIAKMIQTADARAECEVLIVCRGGGSLEDLWAFNEAEVAYALADCRLPVITGIGHETDFTIADFVADYRAATPTAAAQAAVPDGRELRRQQQGYCNQLQRLMQNRLYQHMQRLDYLQRRLVHPRQRIRQQGEQLTQLQQRLQRAVRWQQQRYERQWKYASERLLMQKRPLLQQRQIQPLSQQLMRAQHYHLQQRVRQLDALQHQLELLNPGRVMSRGYALVQNDRGQVVLNSQQTKPGEALRVTLASGRLRVEVKRRDRAATE